MFHQVISSSVSQLFPSFFCSVSTFFVKNNEISHFQHLICCLWDVFNKILGFNVLQLIQFLSRLCWKQVLLMFNNVNVQRTYSFLTCFPWTLIQLVEVGVGQKPLIHPAAGIHCSTIMTQNLESLSLSSHVILLLLLLSTNVHHDDKRERLWKEGTETVR